MRNELVANDVKGYCLFCSVSVTFPDSVLVVMQSTVEPSYG